MWSTLNEQHIHQTSFNAGNRETLLEAWPKLCFELLGEMSTILYLMVVMKLPKVEKENWCLLETRLRLPSDTFLDAGMFEILKDTVTSTQEAAKKFK